MTRGPSMELSLFDVCQTLRDLGYFCELESKINSRLRTGELVSVWRMTWAPVQDDVVRHRVRIFAHYRGEAASVVDDDYRLSLSLERLGLDSVQLLDWLSGDAELVSLEIRRALAR